MKIAFYSNSWDANAGGGIVYLLSLARLCNEAGHTVIVFFYDTVSDKELKQRYNTAGLQLKFISRKGMSFKKQFFFALKEYRNLDMVIKQSLVPPRLTFLRKSYIICDFPIHKELTLIEKIKLFFWKNIIVNSHFTGFWVSRFWRRNSIVLYPPVEIPKITKEVKSDWVSIGRFHAGRRSKKQEVVLEAFKNYVTEYGFKGNLHLIGFVQDKEYLKSLKSLAEGYSVYFYENTTNEVKNSLLRKSAIYIHACGFNEDENLHPELMEHYGISVVESMAYGCIPMVLPKGGPKEIVQHGKNGFYWETIEELNMFVRKLFEDPAKVEIIRNATIQRARFFSNETLKDKFKTYLRL